MADRTCPRCQKTFAAPCRLKAHLARKTPCDPILSGTNATTAQAYKCRYCGRRFSSAPSVNRHTRQFCKIAMSDEGMDKLMEHTLQRQLTGLEDKLARLTALLEKQLTPADTPQPLGVARVENVNQVIAGSVTNVQQMINIVPWDGERRIDVDVTQMAAAFAENARLKEYASLDDRQRTDPDLAPPYVAELFMDLVKRGHTDPASRNVYLNPRRADQALVHLKCGRWEVVPLQEATRLLFDGVAQTIHQVVLSNEERKQLPMEAQNALSLAGLMYGDGPDEYVKRARAPMSAHLANTAPRGKPLLCEK